MVAVTLALGGCSQQPSSAVPAEKPLTLDEADRLAEMRLRNYEDRGARFVANLPDPGGTVQLDGRLDWRNHVGDATVRLLARPGAPQVPDQRVVWSRTEAVIGPVSGTTGNRIELTSSRTPLAITLRLLLALSATRADNPELLRQGGAVILRSDTVDGTTVDVFRGPAVLTDTTEVQQGEQRTAYWVDRAGVLRRFEARIADDAPAVVVRFTARGPQRITTPAGAASDPPR
ncbi:MAG: hypothetical protein ACRC35_11515 [Angustibacter sp.]